MPLKIRKLILYWHTLKYLRAKQVLYRLYYRFLPINFSEKKVTSLSANDFYFDSTVFFDESFLGDNKFIFLGEEGTVAVPEDWNNQSMSKLWLYNLHYFDDLNANGYHLKIESHHRLILRWIIENPINIGNGWEAYPLSLRLVNMVKWCSRQAEDDGVILKSIYFQVEVLSKKLECHILGNHLFANAKALIFVGCFLKENLALKYLSLGLSILDKELKEQFLADGAHFELSPMYHEILLLDLLELIDLGQVSQHSALLKRMPEWRSVAEKALSWLGSMLHPDGEISFFNDAAIGVAAKPQQIFNYAKKLDLRYMPNNETLVTNNTSGYSRVKTDSFTLLFDHANIGPDYLPGHAHADTLSFEMSVGQHRLFVNSGTSLYGVSEERLRQRETAAHNTVVVHNQNSSEVWSGFRVARRAYGKLLSSESYKGKVILVASHDGYKRLRPKVIHTRSIEAEVDGCSIVDKLSSPETACYHLHLHPDVIVLEVEQQTLLLQLPCLTLVKFKSSLPLTLQDSTWHPEFGMNIGNKKITIPFADGYLSTNINVLKADR